MDKTEFITELNARFNDADDFALTQDMKDRAVEAAFRDKDVGRWVIDETIAINSSTTYDVSTIVDTVVEVKIKNGDEYVDLSAHTWRQIGGNLLFVDGVLPRTGNLVVVGFKKYASTDTINEPELQELVLALAKQQMISMLLNQRGAKFLKNKTTVAQLIAWGREVKDEIEAIKSQLSRQALR